MTAAKLIAARHRLGYTQSELAVELGISRSAVDKMERGQRPIERRTDLAIRYLLTGQRRPGSSQTKTTPPSFPYPAIPRYP